MLIPGTEMHLITFGFVCVEIILLFYLIIHRLAITDDKISNLDILLLALLIAYNVTGGLLPDPSLKGSYFVQNSIAYATGFMTPCYFPYYVFKAFGLEKMKFHAYRGVFYFLIGPYLCFVIAFAISGNLNTAKNLLVLPAIYAVWVIYSLIVAVKDKYRGNLPTLRSNTEIIAMFLSLISWVGLPAIDYFGLGQAIEVSFTNTGFLLLLGLHIRRSVEKIRIQQRKLAESEMQLLNLREHLQHEIEKRTREVTNLKSDERIEHNCIRYGFTSREKEIVKLVCQGKSNLQIGESLYISDRTVAKHLQNMFEKINASNRVELIQKLSA